MKRNKGLERSWPFSVTACSIPPTRIVSVVSIFDCAGQLKTIITEKANKKSAVCFWHFIFICLYTFMGNNLKNCKQISCHRQQVSSSKFIKIEMVTVDYQYTTFFVRKGTG